MKTKPIKRTLFAMALMAGLMAIPSGAALANEGLESDSEKLSVTVKDRATGLIIASTDWGEGASARSGSPGDQEVGIQILDTSVSESGDSGTITYEVLVTFPQASATPRDSTGGTTTSSGVTATVTANYSTRWVSGSKQILINSVSGSWTTSLSSIFLQSREVHAHQGMVVGGVNKHWYPTSNSFSYSTGWSSYYEDLDTSVYYNEVTSYCIASVSGMSGDYEINARARI